jgi:hypothetical protein
MKGSIFKRSRNIWKTETEAYSDVIAKQDLQGKQVATNHTQTHFVWEVKLPSQTGNQPAQKSNLYQVEKIKVENKQIAKEQATKYFDTFEGNIQELESNIFFIFKKVRQ